VVVGVVVLGVVVVGVVVLGVVVVGVVVLGVVVVGVVVVGGEVTSQVATTLAEPLSLITFTVKVWVPPARLEYATGPAQTAGAALSSQQEMVLAFVDVQASVTLVLAVEPVGGEERVTVGTGRTTCQVYDARAEPRLLATLTTKLWLPTVRPVYVFGLPQLTAALASSRHVFRTFVPFVEKAKVALVFVVGLDGAVVIRTVGAPLEFALIVAALESDAVITDTARTPSRATNARRRRERC
jgi:hypothetical protein